MSAAYTGFGSGPYDTLTYDRSWVTAFVTLGVSATDSYLATAYYTDTATVGAIVEAIKAADGRYFTSISLGFGVAIPAVSVGGNYQGTFNLGAVVAKEHTAAGHFNNALSFVVSVNDVISETYFVNDTVTLGTSVAESMLVKVSFNNDITLGSDFTYITSSTFTANNRLTFPTEMVAFVSSTGRFIDQWTSVDDSAIESWTSVSLGFD